MGVLSSILPYIITGIVTFLCTGIGTFFMLDINKKKGELENENIVIKQLSDRNIQLDNDCKGLSERCEKYYNEILTIKDEHLKLVLEKDVQIEKLNKDIQMHRDNEQSITTELMNAKIKIVELDQMKCKVMDCENRRPPSPKMMTQKK